MKRNGSVKANMEEIVDFFIEEGKVYKLRDWNINGHRELYKRLVGSQDYKNFIYTASRIFKAKWKTIGQKKEELTVITPPPKVEASFSMDPLAALKKTKKVGESIE